MAFLTVCLNPTIQKTLRFSEVVPGTVNRTGEHRIDVSGKGINVTRVLTQLGKKATHLTQLGGIMRPLFLSLCEKDGLPVEWVESNSEIRFCYTMLTDSNVTELVEEAAAVGSGTEERLMEKYDALLGANDFSWLIISGTKAAGFSETLIPQIVRKAKEKGVKVILDVKGNDLIGSLRCRPDIIKPNIYEFVYTFEPYLIKNNDFARDKSAEKKIREAMHGVNKNYGTRIILTDAEKKIITMNEDDYYEIEVKPVKTVNTIGCGDAFTAGLASALEDGADFHAAIAEGIRCGALNAALVRPGVIC